MKKILFLSAMIAAFAISGFGQTKPTDFSGSWMLDLPKSKVSERMRIESLDMTVTQTDKVLTVASSTKRAPAPANVPAGAPSPGSGGGGMGRGAGFGGGDRTVAYSLDGKETTVEIDGPNGKMPIKHLAKFEGAKVVLSESRTFNGPRGALSATTKEIWSLSADGKTLTVERENTTPRGVNTSTLVFVKK